MRLNRRVPVGTHGVRGRLSIYESLLLDSSLLLQEHIARSLLYPVDEQRNLFQVLITQLM